MTSIGIFLKKSASVDNVFWINIWQILVGRRLLCSKYGRQRGASSLQVSFTKEIFLFSTEWYSFFLLWAYFSFFFFLFLLLFFFYKGLFSALDFSVSKDFSISKELLRVNF